MSPEQARGQRRRLSHRSILVWRAACTRWRPARFAFRRDSVADTLSAVLHEEPQADRASSTLEFRRHSRWIVEQCLAKDANERYSASDDLARELRRVRDRLLRDARLSQPSLAAEPAMLAPCAVELPWRLVDAAGERLMSCDRPLSRIPDVRAAASFTPLRPLRRNTRARQRGRPMDSRSPMSADVDGVLQMFVRRIGDVI